MADVKRLNYFTSQFLVEKDFKDEQSYFVDMRRRHNQSLHSWGVAGGGLQVTKAGDKIVTVSPGMAIDRDGREIVLLDGQSKDLASFGSNADIYLTVKYQEVSDPGDHYTAGGVDNYTRTTERPLVEASTTVPPADGSAIVLAKVSLDGNGNIGKVDNSARRLAGSALDPTIDLAGRSLTVTGNGSLGGNLGVGTTTPENAEGWNRVLDVLGVGNSKLSVRTGAIDARIMAHDAGFWGSAGGMVIGTKSGHALSFGTGAATRMVIDPAGRVGVGTVSPDRSLTLANATGANYLNVKDGTHEILLGVDGAGGILSVMTNHDLSFRAGTNSEKMRITAAGNVGIGTSSPNARLQVMGGAIMPSVGNSEAAGIQFPQDPGGGGGDRAFIRYFATSGETTKLLIGIGNDADDTLVFQQAGGERMTLSNGNVGIGTATPQAPLHVASSMAVGLYGLPNFQGRFIVTGPVGELGFAKRSLGAWPAAPAAGDRFVWYNPDGSARLWTEVVGDLIQVMNNGFVRLLSNSNPLYFTNVWQGYPDAVTNTAEISNDIGTYKTLMIIGNKSGGLGRRVSVWDRFEVNGVFVNNSSKEVKQDLQMLSDDDYQEVYEKLVRTPLYRYRFKAAGIDEKRRLGVITEESPPEILDETGKCVSFLDYVGFLFAAIKAQANEINRLASMIEGKARGERSIGR